MSSGGEKWTAIVLAGQRPSGDPLADHFDASFKALIRIAGKPMLAHVVDALADTPAIGRIVVLAQDCRVMSALEEGRAQFVASGAGISSSIAAVAGTSAVPWPVLVTTADHPLLTSSTLTTFLEACTDCDLAVGLVERGTLQRAYPGNRRTWLKLRDGQWTGANLFALKGPKVRVALSLWSDVEQDRKKAWTLIRRFGPRLAVRAATRTIGLRSALARAGARMGLTAKLVDLPFAEAAIDVDKPADHALAEAILLRR